MDANDFGKQQLLKEPLLTCHIAHIIIFWFVAGLKFDISVKLFLSYSTAVTGMTDIIVTTRITVSPRGESPGVSSFRRISRWEQTMLLNRTLSGMAFGLMVLLASSSVFGQGLAGMQLFAPAELSSYGRGPQPNVGYFFVFDGLYWTITPPNLTTIGKQGLTRTTFIGTDLQNDVLIQNNTLDTGQLLANFVVGNRFEFGRMTENNGWMFSLYQLQDQGQSFISHNVDMTFEDPVFGPASSHLLEGKFTNPSPPPDFLYLELPVTFENILVENTVSHWNVELNYVGRSDELHHGGYFEWFIGPRYMEFDDVFLVVANGGILDASLWNTEAENHIISGQVGARWFKKRGRWMLSTEGRFFAGLNAQNIHQIGQIASNLTSGQTDSGTPYLLQPTSFNHNEYIREFTPGIELRIEARYQITRSISFRAGWTGMWMDGIARASNLVDYTLDGNNGAYLGILRDQNRQDVFVNGLTIGFDVNR